MISATQAPSCSAPPESFFGIFGIREPPAGPGEPVEEAVGTAGRVGADQRLPAPPQVLEELGQGECTDWI